MQTLNHSRARYLLFGSMMFALVAFIAPPIAQAGGTRGGIHHGGTRGGIHHGGTRGGIHHGGTRGGIHHGGTHYGRYYGGHHGPRYGGYYSSRHGYRGPSYHTSSVGATINYNRHYRHGHYRYGRYIPSAHYQYTRGAYGGAPYSEGYSGGGYSTYPSYGTKIYVDTAPYASSPDYRFGDARVLSNPNPSILVSAAGETVRAPALEDDRQVVAEAPDSWDDHAMRQGWALLAKGEGAAARRAFAAAAEVKTGAGMPKFGYALASGQIGELTRATWAMRRGLRFEADAFVHVILDPELRPMVEDLIRQYEAKNLFNHDEGDKAFMRAALHYLLRQFDAAQAAIDTAREAHDNQASTLALQRLIRAARTPEESV